jgi:hypothetical protein
MSYEVSQLGFPIQTKNETENENQMTNLCTV